MTSPELVAHILKSGGRLLVVGGETKDLPRAYHDHAQILIWDDNQRNLEYREIPSNVKVIMWSRWISHNTARKLNEACKSLNALKFPMLRPREIKLLLSEIVQVDEPQKEIPAEVIEQEIEAVNKTIPAEESEQEVKETTEMAKKQILGRGVLKDFIAKNIDINKDFTVKGSKTKEGARLFDIAKKENVKTTLASLTNALGIFIRDMGSEGIGKTAKTKTTTTTKPSTGDDFEELERLIADAIVAMKLVQEHLPKVRKETEKLRGLKVKFLKLLE